MVTGDNIGDCHMSHDEYIISSTEAKLCVELFGRRRSDLKQHQLILDVGSHFLN